MQVRPGRELLMTTSSLSCTKCGQRVEVFVKAFYPDFEAYKNCGCKPERIDHHVTVRWFECTDVNAAK